MADLGIILENFSKDLLAWNSSSNSRQMPWKGEADPYKIWLSEIILQQTRVEQGLGYYLRFIDKYPTIKGLANAPLDEVYKLWEGLGYYSRCKNLHETAGIIAHEQNGEFPANYEKLLKLKGVGPYTAAAIASFAFRLPYAVTDGNVYRILSRVTGIDTPIDSTEGKKIFSLLSNQLLNKEQPDKYNQAIMDFGATICKPASPLCDKCPFASYCHAFNYNRINELPVKAKKTKVKKRWFFYFLFEYEQNIAIRKRLGKDIWHNLFEYLMVETSLKVNPDQVLEEAFRSGKIEERNCEVEIDPETYTQQLSHQTIICQFIKIRLSQKPEFEEDIQWIHKENITEYAFPGIINDYHKKRSGKEVVTLYRG